MMREPGMESWRAFGITKRRSKQAGHRRYQGDNDANHAHTDKNVASKIPRVQEGVTPVMIVASLGKLRCAQIHGMGLQDSSGGLLVTGCFVHLRPYLRQ